MAYVLIIEQPGHSMDDFRAVREALGDEPGEGSIAVGAGPTADGIRVIAISHSRQPAQRFSAERLGPAFAKVLGGRPAGPKVTDFELDDLSVRGVAAAA
jgi:hypothetical protein